MKHVEVVCAIIINDNNEVFVCKRGPGRALEGYWEFPGGKLEANETLEETIVREIKEELDSDILPIKYIGKNYHEYTNIDKPFSITIYGYICKLVKGNLTLSEHTAKEWVNVNELDKVDFAEADKLFINMIKEVCTSA